MMAVALTGCALETEPEDVETSEIEAAASVYQWIDRGTIAGQLSDQQVGLAEYNGKLHMVHTGVAAVGTGNELYMSSYNGSSWSSQIRIRTASVRATNGPALVAHDGLLHMVFRAANQNRLVMSTMYQEVSYGPAQTIGSHLGYETIVGKPSAASWNGQIYVAYCTKNALRIDRFDGGSTWTLVKKEQFSTSTTCNHVGLTVIPETATLHVVYATNVGSQQLMHEQVTWDGTGWYYINNNNLYGMKTNKPVSMVTCNGITHMVHGGYTSHQVYWAERYNGIWKYDYAVPNQVSYNGGAAVGCLGSRAIMVHNGLNTLKWLQFGN